MEASHDALRDFLVRHVGSAVLCHSDGAVACDDEPRDDASGESRIFAEGRLVAETEPTEVLANDALDDLRRNRSVRLDRRVADRRRLHAVTAATRPVADSPAVLAARSEAPLAGPAAAAADRGPDTVDPDAFALSAATLA